MRFMLRLHSRTPLLQNNKRQMFPPFVPVGGGSRRGEKLSPQEQAERSAYPLENGLFGHPTGGLRRAILDASMGYKVGRAGARKKLGAAMDIEPYQYFTLTDAEGRPLSEYLLHEDITTNPSTGGKNLKGWPKWEEWYATLDLSLNERYWPRELLPMFEEILTDAGMSQGLGDYRPGSPKNPGLGVWGKFTWELEELEERSS